MRKTDRNYFEIAFRSRLIEYSAPFLLLLIAIAAPGFFSLSKISVGDVVLMYLIAASVYFTTKLVYFNLFNLKFSLSKDPLITFLTIPALSLYHLVRSALFRSREVNKKQCDQHRIKYMQASPHPQKYRLSYRSLRNNLKAEEKIINLLIEKIENQFDAAILEKSEIQWSIYIATDTKHVEKEADIDHKIKCYYTSPVNNFCVFEQLANIVTDKNADIKAPNKEVIDLTDIQIQELIRKIRHAQNNSVRSENPNE